MTGLAAALLAELDDQALDELAALLAPRLAAAASQPAAAMTTREAAAHATVHERTIRRALAAGTLTGATRAGRWRIEPDDLEDWLARGAPTTSETAIGNGRARGRGPDTAGTLALAGPSPRMTTGAAT